MGKKKKGFFDSIAKDIIYHSMMELARDPKTGKVDPYAAAGIAFGSGKMKAFEDQMRLAAHLGAAGAFDPDETESEYDWREYCEDGSEFGLDPYAYETADEYEEALEEAKYGWRDIAEDGSEYGLDPEDYETADEYEDALEKAKYGWRDEVEDGSEYGLDPEAYETSDEYEQALEEAKYGWRDEVEDGLEYGLDPEDYETADEYEQALEEAQRKWRANVPDGSDVGINPYDYDSEAEYLSALSDIDGVYISPDELPTYRRRRLEAQLCEMDYQQYMDNVRHFRRFGIDPDDYENMADYFRTVAASLRDAHKLKELRESNANSAIRKAAERLYTIKYDFGIVFSDDAAKDKEIRRLELVLKEFYTCEVPKFEKKSM